MNTSTLDPPLIQQSTPSDASRVMSLKIPQGVHIVVNTEDFTKLSTVNDVLRLELASDGGLIVMAPASPDGSERELELGAQLRNWNKARKLGNAFGATGGFTLPNGAIRAPDASWIRRERWEALDSRERERFSHIAPDFVAEIRSPSDSLPDLQAKMAEYIEQGVRLGWLIDPTTQTVEIHRAGRPPEKLEKPRTLAGEDVLPDFTLELADILYD